MINIFFLWYNRFGDKDDDRYTLPFEQRRLWRYRKNHKKHGK